MNLNLRSLTFTIMGLALIVFLGGILVFDVTAEQFGAMFGMLAVAGLAEITRMSYAPVRSWPRTRMRTAQNGLIVRVTAPAVVRGIELTGRSGLTQEKDASLLVA